MVVLPLSSEPDCPGRLGHLRHPVIFLEPHLTGALWVHGIGARPRLEAHQHVRGFGVYRERVRTDLSAFVLA